MELSLVAAICALAIVFALFSSFLVRRRAEALQYELEACAVRIAELEDELHAGIEAQVEIVAENAALSDENARLGGLQDYVDALEGERAMLSEDNERLNRMVADARQMHKVAAESLSTDAAKLSAQSTSLAGLLDRLESVDVTMTRLQEESAPAPAGPAETGGENKGSLPLNEKAKLVAENGALVARLAKLSGVEAELADVRARFSELRAEQEQLRAAMSEQTSAHEKKMSELSAFRSAIESNISELVHTAVKAKLPALIDSMPLDPALKSDGAPLPRLRTIGPERAAGSLQRSVQYAEAGS